MDKNAAELKRGERLAQSTPAEDIRICRKDLCSLLGIARKQAGRFEKFPQFPLTARAAGNLTAHCAGHAPLLVFWNLAALLIPADAFGKDSNAGGD